jgi:hypothetical protein
MLMAPRPETLEVLSLNRAAQGGLPQPVLLSSPSASPSTQERVATEVHGRGLYSSTVRIANRIPQELRCEWTSFNAAVRQAQTARAFRSAVSSSSNRRKWLLSELNDKVATREAQSDSETSHFVLY